MVATLDLDDLAEANTCTPETIAAIQQVVEPDENQQRWLRKLGATLDEQGMFTYHTYRAKQIHEEEGLPGEFETLSPGTDLASHNGFGFCQPDGSLKLYRSGTGVVEHESWQESASGYKFCRFGVVPSFQRAAELAGFVETEPGSYWCDCDQKLKDFGTLLGVDIKPTGSNDYEIQRKNGKIVIKSRKAGDVPAGWGKKGHKLVCSINDTSPPLNIDEYIRTYRDPDVQKATHGYFKRGGTFQISCRKGAEDCLALNRINKAYGMGLAQHDPWQLTAIPFEVEYPARKVHNFRSAQLLFEPDLSATEADCPTWMRSIDHVGQGLDDAVRDCPWCRENGLKTGPEYLMAWMAIMFRRPIWKTPYLFLYGAQNSGKSTIPESLEWLMSRGVYECSRAATSPSGWNSRMAGCVVAHIEETHLGRSPRAHERIKSWVTGSMLEIRAMNTDEFRVPNYTHWIHTANDITSVPLFDGDSRIVVWEVPPFPEAQRLPLQERKKLMLAEASAFLGLIWNTNIDWKSNHRLNLPVLMTADKQKMMNRYFDEAMRRFAGTLVHVEDFFQALPNGTVPNTVWCGRKLRERGATKEGNMWRIPKLT